MLGCSGSPGYVGLWPDGIHDEPTWLQARRSSSGHPTVKPPPSARRKVPSARTLKARRVASMSKPWCTGNRDVQRAIGRSRSPDLMARCPRSRLHEPKQASSGPSTGYEVFVQERQAIRFERLDPVVRSANLLGLPASVFPSLRPRVEFAAPTFLAGLCRIQS